MYNYCELTGGSKTVIKLRSHYSAIHPNTLNTTHPDDRAAGSAQAPKRRPALYLLNASAGETERF